MNILQATIGAVIDIITDKNQRKENDSRASTKIAHMTNGAILTSIFTQDQTPEVVVAETVAVLVSAVLYFLRRKNG